ncbi:uncharacterized protein LOC113563037 [Ooceraea biroi]|uniref:uncharacterized protein LOC113563037 n=1 Tax=Ooceraea biroi TaxID=2015173 RepID=UPI000F0846FD|nr:uncharacterized protein LOC113563037 [Ooceraea biroi]
MTENYDRVWKALSDYYENKRLLIRSYFSNFTTFQKLKNESVIELRKLLHCLKSTTSSLESIGRALTNSENLFVFLAAQLESIDPPTYQELEKFLDRRLHTLKSLLPVKTEDSSSGSGSSKSTRSLHARKQDNKFESKRGRCALCYKDHFVMLCDDYKGKSAQDQKRLVETSGLCFNCLSRHKLSECASKKVCTVCGDRHHSSLHDAYLKAEADKTSLVVSEEVGKTALVAREEPVKPIAVLLATARIRVADRSGNWHQARALVDPGSETSLISEDLAQRLKLSRSASSVAIFGVGGSKAAVARGRIDLSISPRFPGPVVTISALILPRLTIYAGGSKVDVRDGTHLSGLELADPEFRQSDPIDVLLGADVYADILVDGLRRGDVQQPVAQNTSLGWLLSGAFRPSSSAHCSSFSSLSCSLQCSAEEELSGIVRRFWEQEEVPSVVTSLSKEELECEEYFVRTHSRQPDGRYVVRLPISSPQLPDLSRTRRAAERLLRHMERRFIKDTRFHSHYVDFLLQYEDLGHMTRVPVADPAMKRVCYLPHHGVLRESSISTKLRVVFNGLSTLPSGDSLNRSLHAGPSLLPVLSVILLLWRRYRYVLATDLDRICKAGGFPLKKWSVNHAAILEEIPEEDRLHQERWWQSEESHSTLGLRWHPFDDSFSFKIELPPVGTITKRSVLTVLSRSAKIFDPLGWLSPATVRAKIYFQATWLLGFDWDASLPDKDARRWRDFFSEVRSLEEIRVPRWMAGGTTDDDCTTDGCQLQIHGFADASERAYRAVIYLRTEAPEGSIQVRLIAAKIRVAPLKQITLPRLELCASSLLVQLTVHVRQVLQLEKVSCHLWSDSIVALGWIRGYPSSWKTFVANRVSAIQTSLSGAIWHHVPGNENPADCASRGISPKDLRNHPLWWQDPPWLQTALSSWPASPGDTHVRELPEKRNQPVSLTTTTAQESESCVFFQRFSSLNRLLRVSSWCRRWLRLSSHQQSRVSQLFNPETPLILQVTELTATRQCLIRIIQSISFKEEISAVRKQAPLSSRSAIIKLNPFLDEQGLLRVGGRLKYSLLSIDQKHPIILPRDSHVTRLIIEAAHRRVLHGGVQLTLSAIRQEYWVPRGRALVKKWIHRCVSCVRWRAAVSQPLIGDLPAPRVTPARPFLNTGLDYAGPIWIRTSKGRGHRATKAFIVVFVCLSTRAVHLDVVSDYTADAFLAALRRFVSCQGLCRTLFSDCGTNFIGADAQLRSLFAASNSEGKLIAARLADEQIHWRFNPPAGPNFGGIWEAAVKSLKHHLRRVIGDAKLTYEEMATLLAQIESCLNSRPLQAISDDPEDLSVLTPGHFLIGAPLNAVPEPSLVEDRMDRLSRWKQLQAMRDHFWSRWSKEYLHSLAHRPKWQQPGEEIHVGRLVLLRNETTPPNKWPLARKTELHSGKDGHVRVVTVRTSFSTLRRPVSKLVLLPDSIISRNEA